MRRNRRGPFKKKAGGPDVRYHRGDQVDFAATNGEQIYRLNPVEQNRKLHVLHLLPTHMLTINDSSYVLFWFSACMVIVIFIFTFVSIESVLDLLDAIDNSQSLTKAKSMHDLTKAYVRLNPGRLL